MNLRRTLESRLRGALVRCGAPEGSPAVVAPSPRPEFGDYQASGAMAAAKRLKTNPRQLAQKVADLLMAPPDGTAGVSPAAADRGAAGGEVGLRDLADRVEVAGPGFINIFLKPEFLQGQLASVAADERLGAESPAKPQAVVVDYSAPNLAKEMHVGHLRSTIIGDALVRVLGFLGHNVIRQNHVGDWGTQFGMLVAFLDDMDATDDARADVITRAVHIRDREEFYRAAKSRYDTNPAFAAKSREFVVTLQAGSDEHVREEWRRCVDLTWYHCAEVYQRLGVSLTASDVRGESAYNDDLPKVVEALRNALPAGQFRESQGAKCVFLDDFKGKDGEPLPFIVQKSDEGYLYATTDLAAIRYRLGELKADRILYVVDARQSLHFKMLFAVARKAGFAPEGVSLEHVPFGTVMGPDGRPFKTRTGGTVKLMDLLEEGVKKALDLVTRKNAEDVEKGRAEPLSDEQKRTIAEAVGIGAVKYADLAQNRASDYVFAFDKMLSLDGNTAPYMQYAYARIRSIFRKGAESGGGVPPSRLAGILPASIAAVPGAASSASSSLVVSHPAERALAVKLLQFPETVEAVAEQCLPNILCNYLYELAGLFMGFYENCPVLQSEDPLRASRLALCDLAAKVIRQGLDLLGIGTIERM